MFSIFEIALQNAHFDTLVCILKGNFKDTKHRKLTELQFIINFDSNKIGFNKDISFLSKYDTFKH